MPRAQNTESGAYTDVFTGMKIFAPVSSAVLEQLTPVEVILGESLLTPGLQTSVRVQSYIHSTPLKNLEEFKNKNLSIELDREVNSRYGFPTRLDVSQVIYRMDNRKLINNNTEEFTLHACDQTLLNDAES
jgi:hypothetical protein